MARNKCRKKVTTTAPMPSLTLHRRLRVWMDFTPVLRLQPALWLRIARTFEKLHRFVTTRARPCRYCHAQVRVPVQRPALTRPYRYEHSALKHLHPCTEDEAPRNSSDFCASEDLRAAFFCFCCSATHRSAGSRILDRRENAFLSLPCRALPFAEIAPR